MEGGIETKKCPFCGSTQLITDNARGEVVCGNPECGELVEDGVMTNEVQFVASGGGGVSAAGTRVVWSDSVGGGPGGCITTAQDEAITRGMTKIGWISDRLNLSAQLQTSGRRMYQLSVQMGFNVGRPTRFVACACLYVVCRRNRSPHLLIDFSDVLQTPVMVLGRVYMKLLRRLVGRDPGKFGTTKDMGEVIPQIDPSLFIERFSVKMKLGPMQNRVKKTAMVLIQFMQRDWICVGRRPNGLCGAALLVAAFYHGMKCTAKEVADIVRMSEGTIRLRLWEMNQTPLNQMSIQSFAELEASPIDVEGQTSSCVPPCMQRHMRKKQMMALLDGQAAIEDGSAVLAVQDRSQEVGASVSITEALTDHLVPASSTAACDAVVAGAATVGGLPQGSAVASQDEAMIARYESPSPSGADVEEMARDITQKLMGAVSPVASSAGQVKGSSAHEDSPHSQAAASPLPIEAAAQIEKLSAGLFAAEGAQSARSEEGLDGLDGIHPSQGGSAASVASDCEDEEPLDDVDDEELAMYCLDLEEQQHKSDIWHEVNKDYLEEWHVRGQESLRKKKRKTDGKDAGKPGRAKGAKDGTRDGAASEGGDSRKSRRSTGSMSTPPSSTAHAVAQALASRGKVKADRINLDALESLFA